MAPLSSQKVSYVSFQNTDNLQVYFTDLDSGDKTVIVDNVAYLTLSGRMYERAASMRIFVRNSPSVQFEDFYATTPILLINLMVRRTLSKKAQSLHFYFRMWIALKFLTQDLKMWPQQNLCEYPIVKMNMEQRPAANQSFLETIHSQVKQKTKSN